MANKSDLMSMGFSSDEIKAMYLINEPVMKQILDAAAELDEDDRRVVLALTQAFLITRLRHAAQNLCNAATVGDSSVQFAA